MSKLVMIFFAFVALIQIIKPLGLPGLKRRGDAWKLAVAGFITVVVLIGLRPDGDPEKLTKELNQPPPADTTR